MHEYNKIFYCASLQPVIVVKKKTKKNIIYYIILVRWNVGIHDTQNSMPDLMHRMILKTIHHIRCCENDIVCNGNVCDRDNFWKKKKRKKKDCGACMLVQKLNKLGGFF